MVSEDLEVITVHDSSEETIGVVHLAVVDDEVVVIGYYDEPIPSCLPNPTHLVRHPTALLTLTQVHHCYHWGLVDIALEVRFVKGEAAVHLGNHHKFKQTVLYVGYLGLFRQWPQLYITCRVPAT